MITCRKNELQQNCLMQFFWIINSLSCKNQQNYFCLWHNRQSMMERKSFSALVLPDDVMMRLLRSDDVTRWLDRTPPLVVGLVAVLELIFGLGISTFRVGKVTPFSTVFFRTLEPGCEAWKLNVWNHFWLAAVLPYVGMKSSPYFPNVAQQLATAGFICKVNCPKSKKMFGLLL